MPIDTNKLVLDVVSREGGYVDNSADRGGPTKYGITQKTLSRYLRRQATIDEVKNLDMKTAKAIYLLYYYTTPCFDSLPEAIIPQVFDIGVNSGPEKAIQMMQRIVNTAGFGPIDEDGVLGPESQDAIAKTYASMGGYFINALEEERENFYKYLVQKNPSQAVFIKGWLSRAAQFKVKV